MRVSFVASLLIDYKSNGAGGGGRRDPHSVVAAGQIDRPRGRRSNAASPANRVDSTRADERGLLIDGAANYAIYMLDPEGRVTIWNQGAERIKGWRESEIIGPLG